MIARWMIAGFVLWLAVVMSFRFVGEDLFHTGPGGVSWLFLTLPPVMFAITYLLLRVFKVASTDRAEAASIMAVPGLIIGIYMINSYQNVFPNLDPGLQPEFASLMFACYTGVILSGIVSSRLRNI